MKTDERGFILYEDLTDSYGARVSVKESSNASGHHVWIFVEGGGVDNNNGSAHLDINQAKSIRDALSKFIDGVYDRWEL